MGKIVDVRHYPEGVEILAKNMKLPLPEEDIEGRKALIMRFMETILEL